MSSKNKFGLFVSGFVLRTTLFFGFTLLAAVLLIGNRETPKNALVSADAYNRFGQAIIDSSKEQSKNDPNAIPLDDPQIAAIFKASLSPSSLLPLTEGFIDSGYDWLEGKTDTLTFSADLSQNKEMLARGVSNYAIDRLLTLPVCTKVPTETNIFKIPCNPADVDLAQQRDEIYKVLMEDTSVFPDTVLTAADLPKTEDGRTFTEAYAKAPTYYRIFKLAPWILLGIATFTAFLVVFSSRTKRKGLRAVATSLIGTGVILAIAPILYSFILPSIGFSLPGSGSSGNESVSAISNDIMSGLYKDLNVLLINIAIQVIVFGVILFFVSKFLGTNQSPYKGAAKKSGIAVSIDNTRRPKGPKISPNEIPIQTSEGTRKGRRTPSKIEKKFREM